jgi:hypothetical protein
MASGRTEGAVLPGKWYQLQLVMVSHFGDTLRAFASCPVTLPCTAAARQHHSAAQWCAPRHRHRLFPVFRQYCGGQRVACRLEMTIRSPAAACVTFTHPRAQALVQMFTNTRTTPLPVCGLRPALIHAAAWWDDVQVRNTSYAVVDLK